LKQVLKAKQTDKKREKQKRSFYLLHTRVARWYIFKPKIPIGVNFGGPCNEIMVFFGHLV
jgi:hypothetical protein